MAGEVRITNLKAMQRAMYEAKNSTPGAVGRALKPAAEKVAERARSHTRGRIAKGVRAWSRSGGLRGTPAAGIRSNHPGSSVHEFVRNGQQFLRKSASGNVHWVRWRDESARGYMYRARDEMAPQTEKSVMKAVVDTALKSGFLHR